MKRQLSLAAVVVCAMAFSGCLGILDGGPSEPEMDAVDEEYGFSDLPAAAQIKNKDSESPEIFTRLDKNESDPVTLEYTLIAGSSNSTETYYQVETITPEKTISLPDGVDGRTDVQVLVEMRDGNETVDLFIGEYTYDP